MYSEWSKTNFKQNATCEWCTILVFWLIVYLHMANHCPKSQGCTPSRCILKNFYFPQYFPIHSESSKTDFKQNSTCEWCTTLIFWPIVYLKMTNHCNKNQGCTPSGSILKNFYFHNTSLCTQNDLNQILRKTQLVNGVQPWFSGRYFIFTWTIIVPKARVVDHQEVFKNFYFPHYFPMHSEWSKSDFKKNSTCEWCTTLIFWPIVYLYMTNHCPKSQGCIPSGSILKNFYFPLYLPMHSEWSKTDFKQNSTCEWCATLIFWPIVYLHMANHCPKSQGCTPSGSILKSFYFPNYFSMHSDWSKTDFKQNSTCE